MSKKLKKIPPSDSSASRRLAEWSDVIKPGAAPSAVRPFTEDVDWRIFRIMAEFVEGFEFLSKLKHEVTIFGSARAAVSSWPYKEARKLGKLLGKNGYTVVTGGGPGIMEAANRGAREGGGASVGLDIELPKGQRRNDYVDESMGFHYFFTRKVMLSASAQAYVFFPGGFGTMDEVLEMTLLIQTGKITDQVPVILVGKKHWQTFLDWVHNNLVHAGYVNEREASILRLVDSAEEAFAIIQKTSERNFG